MSSLRPLTHRRRALCVAALALIAAAGALLAGSPQVAASPEAPTEGRLLGRIALEGDGLVAVQLPVAIADAIPLETLVVLHPSGRPVPSQAVAADAEKKSPTYLVFPAFATASPFTRTAVFQLLHVPGHKGTPALAAEDGQDENTADPIGIREDASDRIRGPIASSLLPVYDADVPHWYLDRIPLGSGLHRTLDPGGALSGRDQLLEVDLAVSYVGPVAIHADWGGRDLGVQRVDSPGGRLTLRWTVAADKVPREGTALTLTNEIKNPPRTLRSDVSERVGDLWVDAIRLVGLDRGEVGAATRQLRVDGDASFRLRVPTPDTEDRPRGLLEGDWRFAWQPEAHLHHRLVPGKSSEQEQVYRLPAHEGAPWSLMIGTRARIHPLQSVGEDAKGVSLAERAKQRDALLSRTAQSPHLIVTLAPFRDAAERLAAHRAQQGLASAVVQLDEIYDHFSAGHRSPIALRDFLRARMALKSGVELKYVLLVGDATFDRTDIRASFREQTKPAVVLPTMTTRSIYNGATASDARYVESDDGTPLGPMIGRFPATNARQADNWVQRVIDYEMKPPVEANRRMLRFITSEGRFGATIDRMIETLFKRILKERVPPEYAIELTYASVNSPFFWPPPEFNDKVIEGINEGALFYTYVGHGFAQGFDTLRTKRGFFPILTIADVPRVRTKGTPPVMFVLACSTAEFDSARREGIGEMLMRSPAGPIAYFGATRVCHPAGNSVLGYAIAKHMGDTDAQGRLRLGDLLRAMRETSTADKPDSALRQIRSMVALMLRTEGHEQKTGKYPTIDRIVQESLQMYALLGDPALAMPLPKPALEVEAAESVDGEVLEVRVKGPVPPGTKIHVTLELPRDRTPSDTARVGDVNDPAQFPVIRKNHSLANMLAIDGKTIEMGEAGALTTLTLPAGSPAGLWVKAWCLTDKDVLHGATELKD